EAAQRRRGGQVGQVKGQLGVHDERGCLTGRAAGSGTGTFGTLRASAYSSGGGGSRAVHFLPGTLDWEGGFPGRRVPLRIFFAEISWHFPFTSYILPGTQVLRQRRPAPSPGIHERPSLWTAVFAGCVAHQLHTTSAQSADTL